MILFSKSLIKHIVKRYISPFNIPAQINLLHAQENTNDVTKNPLLIAPRALKLMFSNLLKHHINDQKLKYLALLCKMY